MNKQTADKIHRIQQLLKQKADIEQQLEEIVNPKTIIAPPADFNLNDEIVTAVQRLTETSVNGASIVDIEASILQAWPNVTLDRQKINSALVYLASRKHVLERIERGRFVITQNVSTSAQTLSVEALQPNILIENN